MGIPARITPGLVTNDHVALLSAVSLLSGVAATLATGPLNDVGPYLLPGYVSGVTNNLEITPASGGTTITGLDATGVAATAIFFTVLIRNRSTVDTLIFTHLGAGSLSGNQFSNMNGASVSVPPLGAARCTYINNKWQFA